MNLGERQAYETGRKDGWQEAIVALASGAKKLLGPETAKILADALVAGLREQPAAGGDPTDPTEPASWGRSAIRDVHEQIRRFDAVELHGHRGAEDQDKVLHLKSTGDVRIDAGLKCTNCGADWRGIFVVSGGTLAGGPYECQNCHFLWNRDGAVWPASPIDAIRAAMAGGLDRHRRHQNRQLDTIGTRPGDEDRHTVGEHR